MNPYTHQLEQLVSPEAASTLADLRKAHDRMFAAATTAGLVRPDGSPVPRTWATLTVGEEIDVKGSTFRVAYMNEQTVVLEPVTIREIGAVETP